MEGLVFVKTSDIIHCEGSDGYTKIYIQSQKTILSSLNIGHFSKLLGNQDFYLVHKSHLINLDYIDKYLNEGYVLLADKYEVPVSRSRRSKFLEIIKGQ